MGSSVARLSPTYLFWELKLHTGVWRGTGGSGPPFTTSPTDTVSFWAINTDFQDLDNPSGSKNADRFSSTQLPRPGRAHRRSQQGKKTAMPPQTQLLDPLIRARLDRYEKRKLPALGNHRTQGINSYVWNDTNQCAPLSVMAAHSVKVTRLP